tara:strand:- start:1284 stop:2699 length:1416 start_codon:yes stop_codon:yes gene_type:complete
MSDQISMNSEGQPINVSNSGVGPLLRASRQRLGQDLRDVASTLRIRYPYLEAIEAGKFADLPGKTYAVGFVRAYADHLGLDAEEVVLRFKGEIEDGELTNALNFPTPMLETGIPGGAIVFVGLIVAALTYGAWYLSTSEEGFMANLVAPLPDRLAKLAVDAGGSQKSEKQKITEKPSSAADPLTSDTVSVNHQKNQSSISNSMITVKKTNNQTVSQGSPSPSTHTQSITDLRTTPGEPSTLKSLSETNRDLRVTSNEVGNEQVTSTAPSANAKEESTSGLSSNSERPLNRTVPLDEDVGPQSAIEPRSLNPLDPGIVFAQQNTELKAEEDSLASSLDNPENSLSANLNNEHLMTDSEITIPKKATKSEVAAGNANKQIQILSPRIVVRASSNSWIEVKDDFFNIILVSQLLKAGETYDVPDKIGLSLHTGNAGALEITVDGVVVPSIGGEGAVLRGVHLDAESLKAGTAAR